MKLINPAQLKYGWQVLQSDEVSAFIIELESLLCAIFRSQRLVPHIAQLHQLDQVLMRSKQSIEETASTLREMRETVKSSEQVADFLAHSVLAASISHTFQKQAKLHSVVRFRTVHPSLEFTLSRPHQDMALWPTIGEHLVCWIPFIDIHAKNSPLLMAEATNLLPHQCNQFEQYEIESNQQFQFQAIDVCYGQVLLFSPYVVHYAEKNNTDQIRWSLDCRFYFEEQKAS